MRYRAQVRVMCWVGIDVDADDEDDAFEAVHQMDHGLRHSADGSVSPVDSAMSVVFAEPEYETLDIRAAGDP